MNEELVEEGIVVKSENGFVDIKLLHNDACEECSAKIFCKPKEDSSQILSIKNKYGIREGDKVTVSIPGKTLLKAAINLYLYPLLILLTTIILGLNIFTNLSYSELYVFLLGCLFIAIYYTIFFKMSKNMTYKQPKISLSE